MSRTRLRAGGSELPTALDSSFLIDLERGDPDALAMLGRLERSEESLAIPAPALYELLAAAWSTKGRAAARRVEAILGRFPVLPVDLDAARIAAEIRVELRTAGREKPHVDILIAGVALRFGAPLLSRDSDFGDIAENSGLELLPY